MIVSRLVVITRPPTGNAPLIQAGVPTLRLSAPKIDRTACCSTSDRPQVASNVSSGRPYRNRISSRSIATPTAPDTRNAHGTAMNRLMPNNPGAAVRIASCTTNVV